MTLPEAYAVCARCGVPANEHRLANFADGPSIGQTFLVCPTSTFEAAPQRVVKANPMTGNCNLCGEPMPAGEEMFKFHGYSGPCPK